MLSIPALYCRLHFSYLFCVSKVKWGLYNVDVDVWEKYNQVLRTRKQFAYMESDLMRLLKFVY